ncbi:DsbA family protein [Rheinheimera sp. 4Y26]|uniref:DsbA family protein n=1 Tax=Rheinheimera sp. 4Y26 TaxID=2977811 RepID=UPI0021B0A655|nr:DsbA family protein [Rheinheimera sp. 4Y26]MCT6700643.1 DsbA family protein [Rheinheimera sp. 4Y26]
MKRITLVALAALFLTACQSGNNADLAAKVAALEEKVEKLSTLQTEIAQRAGMGALVRPEQLAFADGHQIGQNTAKVAMLEFTDLQCPFCAKFNQEIWPELKKNYVDTGKVLFVAREFPLFKAHPQAPFAALTLRCAATQNLYAEMKDYLFANQGTLKQTEIDAELTRLKADVAKHTECMTNTKLQEGVRDSTLYAGKLGLTSTPTFFIGLNAGNGVTDYQELVGAKSYAEFAAVLDALLAQQ